MPLNDDFVCVVNIRENRVARFDRDNLGLGISVTRRRA